MSTIQKIISRVDENTPNAFSTETKVEWLAELDGRIAMDVFLMDIAEAEQFHYDPVADLNTELLVQFPHDRMYVLYLAAKIHAENGEYDRYQNVMALYNSSYNNFVRWFISVYEPANGCGCGAFRQGNGVPSYYITAYGLAVMRGFRGTLDEWLASLTGPKGEPGNGITGAVHNEDDTLTLSFTDGTSYTTGSLRGRPGDKGDPGEDGKDGADYVLTDADIEQIAQLITDEKIADSVNDLVLLLSGGTMTGAINMGGNKVRNLAEPTEDTDAATKAYVDSKASTEEKVLLWENAAATAAAQNIALGDVSAYSEYIVELQTADGRPFSARGIIGNTRYSGCYMYTNDTLAGTNLKLYLEIRAFRITTDGTFSIHGATQWLLTYSSGSLKATTDSDNTQAVPMRVYGVKEG